jgi:hypothetical protein
MSEKKMLFEVNGFQVFENTIYAINDKKDYDAPDGFIREGTTKLPSSGVGESFGVRFVPRSPGSKEGVWDTGLYPESKCYDGLDEKTRGIRSGEVIKSIGSALLNLYGVEKKDLHQANHDFWQTKVFSVESGKTLSSNNVNDLVTLYYAIKEMKVAPKQFENDTRYKNTSYIVVDVKNDIKKRDEAVLNKYESIGVFTELLKSNRPTLINLLAFMGCPVADGIDNAGLISIFDTFMSENASRIELFNNYTSSIKDSNFQDKLAIFSQIKSGSAWKNHGIEKLPTGAYIFEDIELGADLKTVAESITKDSKLTELKDAILEVYMAKR